MLIYRESKRTKEILLSLCITKYSLSQTLLDKLSSQILAEFPIGSKILDFQIMSLSLIHSDSLTGTYDYSDQIDFLQGSQHFYTEILNGFKFQVAPLAFFQVNSHVFEKMLSKISDWAKLDDRTVLLDLCCGTGVIGICLSKHVKKIIGIELIESAIENSRKNLEINGLDVKDEERFLYIAGKCEDVLPELSKKI